MVSTSNTATKVTWSFSTPFPNRSCDLYAWCFKCYVTDIVLASFALGALPINLGLYTDGWDWMEGVRSVFDPLDFGVSVDLWRTRWSIRLWFSMGQTFRLYGLSLWRFTAVCCSHWWFERLPLCWIEGAVISSMGTHDGKGFARSRWGAVSICKMSDAARLWACSFWKTSNIISKPVV